MTDALTPTSPDDAAGQLAGLWQASEQTRVFISYSRRDQSFAAQLSERLRAAGISVFLDVDDILPAEDWRVRLQGLIQNADAIVLLLSPDALDSAVCRWEIETAAQLGKRLVPVVYREVARLPVPAEVARLNYIFARESDDFDSACASLIEALETDIAWIREHTRLGELAHRWDQQGRSASLLLRGGELLAAEHWLAGKPAKADNPTALQQALISQSRLIANRRQRQLMIAALAIALLSGLLATWAEFNRRIAVSERERVERVLIRTTEATKDLVVGIAGKYATMRGIPHALIVEILSQARKLVEELDSAGATRPELLLNGGLALAELSDALRLQGEPGAALETATASVSVFLQLRAQQPQDHAASTALILAYDRLGDAQFQLGQQQAAMTSYRAGLDIVTALEPSPLQRRYQAIALENVANLQLAAGDTGAALQGYTDTLTLRQALLDSQPDNLPVQRELAISMEKLADLYLADQDFENARLLYLRSLQLTEQVATSNPDHTQWQQDLATACHKVGNALMMQNDPAAALPYFHRDLQISLQLFDSDPDWIDWRQALMVSYERVGNAAWLAGQHAVAVDALAAALQHARVIIREGEPNVAWLGSLAKLYQSYTLMLHAQGRWQDAQVLATEAVESVRQARSAPAAAGDLLPDLYNNLAWFALFNRDFQTALQASEAAQAGAPDNLLYVPNRAHALMYLGRKPEALQLLRAHVGEPVTGVLDWQASVLADYDALQQHGLDHPLITAMRAEWAN